MDALASVGLYGDGRLLALSSYENRVYQLHLEDGRAVVAKFYRPERWTQAQILEEHAFSAELMAAEIPVIGPMNLSGSTLHDFGGFSFSVSPSRGGRPPELDNPEVLEWIGRFLARIHAVGALKPFASRPALNLQTFGTDSRDWLLAQHTVPLDVSGAWQEASDAALKIIANYSILTGTIGSFDGDESPMRQIRLHGDCHPGNILWTPTDVPASAGPGPHFVDLDDARTGPAVQDLWMLLSGDRQQRSRQLGRAGGWLRAVPRIRPPRAGADRAPAHLAAHPLQRLAGPSLGRPDFPHQLSVVWLQRLLEGPGFDARRADGGDAGGSVGGVGPAPFSLNAGQAVVVTIRSDWGGR